ncbi:B3 domain-containing protein Os03g0619800-like [Olea europaea var. sylvestris]|uniref:B3 domain-containing protein Os03g0619800-like n=1 Tax=Olea europaea var. sylvestris TaxID=158386 RepID=UPI000C1D84B5|nr:B3 domain-containing protein Os03g0619800-like [Olea europaea var. sylvestris]
MIPRAFVKDWRHEFDDTVRVITYDGIIAIIKLETVNGKFYLTDGWEQFFDHHNLYDGYCLIFEYTGNSTFNVIIMDDYGLEVKYESDVSEEGEEINNSNIDNPVFEVKLTPRKYGHRKIYILERFAGQHLPKFVRSVKIHDCLHQNWDITTNLRSNGVKGEVCVENEVGGVRSKWRSARTRWCGSPFPQYQCEESPHKSV